MTKHGHRLTVLFLSLALLGSVRAGLPTMRSLPFSKSLGKQSLSDGTLHDQEGRQYELSQLTPFEELLDPNRFVLLEGGKSQQAMELSTGDMFELPILRATYENGSILQAERNEAGTIVYAELRQTKGTADLFFVKTVECDDDELFFFSEEDLDEATLLEGSSFETADALDEEEEEEELFDVASMKLPDFVFQRGDGTSSECPYFKVIKLGVVFDAEFCTLYGGKVAARSRIMMIVAAASVLYENDMCIKIQLVDIMTPDDDCAAPSAFADFPRDDACGSGSTSDTFIRFFRDWANENKRKLGFDTDATYHAFTGFPHRGTLGCAYIGTVCRSPDINYGVDYMSNSRGIPFSLSTQSIILTHELGHNLSARHLSSQDAQGSRYLMLGGLNNPHDGFSQQTSEQILGFLEQDNVDCDGVAFREPTRAPSAKPTTSSPTPSPTVAPTIDTCWLELATPNRCISRTVQDSLYHCYPAHEVMAVRPNRECRLRQPMATQVSYISCVEKPTPRGDGSNDDFPRKVRARRQLLQSTEKNSEGEVSVEHRQLFTRNEGSNDRGLEYFGSDDCSTGCRLEKGHVCFRSAYGGNADSTTYQLSFEADDGSGSEMFTVNVNIQDLSVAGDSSCDRATTSCYTY